MRTYTSSGITITYPESSILSGNRNMVIISGATSYATFKIFGDTRELNAGYGEFDLTPYILGLFVSEEKNAKFSPKSQTVGIYFNGGSTSFLDMEFTEILYGKNRIFDSQTIPTVGEFTEFSKWFEFWSPAEYSAKINGTDLTITEGLNVIDLSAYSSDVVIVIDKGTAETSESTFDYTFGSTFVNQAIINLRYVSCSSDGLILRWLDHFGVWQQKTFDRASFTESGAGTSYGWVEQSAQILYPNLQYSLKKETLSFDAFANSVSLTEAKRLIELCTTGNVHIYDTATSMWIPVVISTENQTINLQKTSQSLTFNVVIANES